MESERYSFSEFMAIFTRTLEILEVEKEGCLHTTKEWCEIVKNELTLF